MIGVSRYPVGLRQAGGSRAKRDLECFYFFTA